MSWWHRVAARRPPDFLVGRQEDPQTLRWHLVPRNRWFNVYLHRWLKSDEDEATHDHPYWNLSIVLQGFYTEWVGDAHERRAHCRFTSWRPVMRWPTTAHKICIMDGTEVWSLFISGPRVREWGFHCPKGWVHFKTFIERRKTSGWKGCE